MAYKRFTIDNRRIDCVKPTCSIRRRDVIDDGNSLPTLEDLLEKRFYLIRGSAENLAIGFPDEVLRLPTQQGCQALVRVRVSENRIIDRHAGRGVERLIDKNIFRSSPERSAPGFELSNLAAKGLQLFK